MGQKSAQTQTWKIQQVVRNTYRQCLDQEAFCFSIKYQEIIKSERQTIRFQFKFFQLYDTEASLK